MDKVLLISIKPEFSDLIFKGQKRIELRKSKPNVQPGSIILIYNTQPEMAVVGFCKIKGLIELPPESIWAKHSEELGIDYIRFNAYYEGKEKAVGIEVFDAIKFPIPIELRQIRKGSPQFSPPQTFKYLTQDKLGFLSKHYQNLIFGTLLN